MVEKNKKQQLVGPEQLRQSTMEEKIYTNP